MARVAAQPTVDTHDESLEPRAHSPKSSRRACWRVALLGHPRRCFWVPVQVRQSGPQPPLLHRQEPTKEGAICLPRSPPARTSQRQVTRTRIGTRTIRLWCRRTTVSACYWHARSLAPAGAALDDDRRPSTAIAWAVSGNPDTTTALHLAAHLIGEGLPRGMCPSARLGDSSTIGTSFAVRKTAYRATDRTTADATIENGGAASSWWVDC